MFVLAAALANMSEAQTCQKVELTGEVSAGQEWRADFGQGWVFRVLPIEPDGRGYSGWDLVVDRAPAAGFPDALLLATPPYNSINEHEVGTTFGLRAQDAIGWNPRSFRFISNPDAFREGQGIYMQMSREAFPRKGGAGEANQSSAKSHGDARLLELVRQSSAGEFRVLDARIIPGISDAAPYAEAWALNSAKTPHQIEAAPNGRPTARGELRWMRFSITLWLPEGWRFPKEVRARRVAESSCQ